MSKIHVATPAGQTEHEETELRALWHQGKFPADAKYWKQGMPDWRPLASYFADIPFNPYASSLHAEPQPVSNNGSYAYAKSPHRLTRFLLVMLSICLVWSILRIASDAMQLSLLSSPYTAEEGMANDQRQSIVAIGWSVIFYTTSIPFLRWVHRINVNCRGFGARSMLLTPGWAVGSFFIPILNFFRPYQSMKQVWQVSRDPADLQSGKGSALVGWWWALWLLSNVTGSVSDRFSKHATTIDSWIQSTWVAIVASAIGAFVSVAAILLVRGIYRMQEALVNPAPQAPGKAS